MRYYVYVIQNTLNLKIYVGKSKKRKSLRFNEHLSLAKLGNSNKNFSLIHAALAKYGVDNFTFQTIEKFEDEQECLEAEKFWISFFRSNVSRFGNECGYNLTDGGDGHSKPCSIETKNKISATLTKRYQDSSLKKELLTNLKDGKANQGIQLNIGCKIFWPENDVLIEMCNASTYKEVALTLGVTPEAISARIKRRKLSSLITEKRRRH